MSDDQIKQAVYYADNIMTYHNALGAELQHLLDALSAGGDVQPPKYTIYNQRDPRWAADRLGTSNTTIGSDGCLITSYASAVSDAGRKIQPDELNTWLIANNGYVSGNHFVFSAPDRLGVLLFDKIVDYNNPAPVAAMNEYINAGGYILVMVDFNPDPAMQQHWCRYIGAGEIIDPWYGDVSELTPRYRGKNAAEAIWRAAYYKKVSA